ncbi:energy-coupling factor transporter ATPase [Spiroplasma eriocheiris]|uniref:Cobalt ABC transporter ATP-binding subunit n=1 Tax=Spiroplasma eriocheiris TaxID=315358 RepID=A0A0H3XJ63_9MOLU|nr:energy-coupling factor transporter ATPase [Spiroplasma eriocheiris]AHF57400.1 ABC-type cobalt transport system ATP-binding protein [Spiroplasma eriocheiris CCTCC M 207170]AKM53856.1 cobalt ABC transporter ATP-binding subunit [Spiroplasma eriocheiris]
MARKKKNVDITLEKLNNISLKLTDIEFRYRENHPNAVDGVSFEINHGEYVTIIGHNGSGKSTISKIIIGVLRPQNGSVEIFGNVMTNSKMNGIRKFLGIVFQNPDNQFIGSTVRDDIAFGLENRRIPQPEMQPIIERVAKQVGMLDFLNHEPLMLSGGQKQRVAIASALALQPEILIFDEATSMLDPKGKKEVKQIMVDLKNTREKTIISITHDMDEILNADKVIVMNKGKMVKCGKPEEILYDEDFLRSIHLDVPFVSKMIDFLKAAGLSVKNTLSLEELVDEICQK